MNQTIDMQVSSKTLVRDTRSDIRYYHVRPRKLVSDVRLVFIHGAFSGGWIWSVYFQPFFAYLGFESFALDLRGRRAVAPYVPSTHGLSDYARDVQDLTDTIDGRCVLIGHSLGGMIAQKISVLHPPAGLALLASVPPEGLSVSAWQMALSNPLLFWNTAVLSMTPQMGNISVTRDALLSPDVSDDIARQVLKMSSPEAPRALMEAQIPLTASPGFLKDTPVCVMGGANDRLIPVSAFERTADFYGVTASVFDNVAHSLMVDTRWRGVAETLYHWLDSQIV